MTVVALSRRPARVLRLEIRRSVVPWAVPLLIALFLFDTYRTWGPQPVAGVLLAAALIRATWAGAVTRPAPTRPSRIPAGSGTAVARSVSGEPT